MVCEVIVKIVSDELAEKSREEGCGVESADLDGIEIIEGSDEDVESGVDAYYPGADNCTKKLEGGGEMKKLMYVLIEIHTTRRVACQHAVTDAITEE